jgi:hypothetical protein
MRITSLHSRRASPYSRKLGLKETPGQNPDGNAWDLLPLQPFWRQRRRSTGSWSDSCPREIEQTGPTGMMDRGALRAGS